LQRHIVVLVGICSLNDTSHTDNGAGSTLNSFNNMSTPTVAPQSTQSPVECVLVIDSGYSHTTITPVFYGRPVHTAIKRLELGGKHLTNYLKEIISLRHIMVMDEPHLVSQMKEDACFVSQDFRKDLESVWRQQNKSARSSTNPAAGDIVQEYVLPDYVTSSRGHLRLRDPTRSAVAARLGAQVKEDFIPLGNERFLVPEIIFNPSDIGMAQAGLAETVVQSLACLPPGLWPAMLANVVIIGGNARIPGFVERLKMELRALTPTECELRVRCPDEYVTFVWMICWIIADAYVLVPSHKRGSAVPDLLQIKTCSTNSWSPVKSTWSMERHGQPDDSLERRDEHI